MSDIDILIRENDLIKAQENLLSNGYTQNRPTYNLQKGNFSSPATILEPGKEYQD